jgi:hypothetical protein
VWRRPIDLLGLVEGVAVGIAIGMARGDQSPIGEPRRALGRARRNTEDVELSGSRAALAWLPPLDASCNMLRKRHDEEVLTLRETHSTLAYRVWLEEEGAGWVVISAEGRLGSTLQLEHQTQAPMAREDAMQLLRSLVGKKVGRGYAARVGQRLWDRGAEDTRGRDINRLGRRVVTF